MQSHSERSRSVLTHNIEAIEVGEEINAADRCHQIIAEGRLCQCTREIQLTRQSGGCDMDQTYDGPKLTVEDGKYTITKEFIEGRPRL
jgi:serine/threonine-protein phosphatase 5